MEKLDNQTMNPPYLYHYTSIQTLFILLTKSLKELDRPKDEPNSLKFYNLCLWGSHISYMNDPSENKFYFNTLKKALNDYEIERELPPRSPYLHIGKDLFEHGEDPYVVSLCEDENSLSMWRCYAANACGVAICFSFQKLSDYINNNPSYKISKIAYKDEGEIHDSIDDNLLESVYDGIIREGSYTGPSTSLGFESSLSNTLANRIDIKHKAYSDEKEWRLYTFQSFPSDFRERNGLIIPYYEFYLPLDAVERIIIGPCAEQTLNKISLERMLKEKIKGLNLSERIVVETSDLPYIIR